VDGWLLSEYPELAPEQKTSANRQLQENLQVLRPDMKKIAPPKVYNANAAMNAAFALFWSRLWDDTKLVTPYTATGHAGAGERLIALLESVPADPDHDRDLIDAWGTQLNLTDWYEFLPPLRTNSTGEEPHG